MWTVRGVWSGHGLAPWMVMAFATVAVGLCADVAAQTLPYPVPATTLIAWDHTGPTTTAPLVRFTLQVDTGSAVDIPPTPVNGPHGTGCGSEPLPICTYEAPFPAVEPGLRLVSVRACNAVGCSKPATLTVQVLVLPATPGQLRVTIGSGGQ